MKLAQLICLALAFNGCSRGNEGAQYWKFAEDTTANKQAIIGSWKVDSHVSRLGLEAMGLAASPSEVLELLEDGSFKAKSLPVENVFKTPRFFSYTGNGKWIFDIRREFNVVLTMSDGSSYVLDARINNGVLSLVRVLGDPDAPEVLVWVKAKEVVPVNVNPPPASSSQRPQ
jgi:hypothetical protein